MAIEVRYPEITVRLTGGDANVFSVIGKVSHAIKRAQGEEAAQEFNEEAFQRESYDQVLQLCMMTVNVE